MCSWIFNYCFLSHKKLWPFSSYVFYPPYWNRKAVTPSLRPLAHLYFIERQSVWELGRNQKQGGPCIPSGSLSLPCCSNSPHRASLRVYTSLHLYCRSGLLLTQCSSSPAFMILLCLLWLSRVQDKQGSDSFIYRSVFVCFNTVASKTEKCFYFVLKWLRTSEKMQSKGRGRKRTTRWLLRR